MKIRIAALCLGLASCTSHADIPSTAPPATASQGVIVAVRTAAPDATLRQTILTAVGASATPGGQSAELVIRMDDGDTISVIQPDAGGLGPGTRVAVLSGAQVTVIPASEGTHVAARP